jgi:hypothetical protein
MFPLPLMQLEKAQAQNVHTGSVFQLCKRSGQDTVSCPSCRTKSDEGNLTAELRLMRGFFILDKLRKRSKLMTGSIICSRHDVGDFAKSGNSTSTCKTQNVRLTAELLRQLPLAPCTMESILLQFMREYPFTLNRRREFGRHSMDSHQE